MPSLCAAAGDSLQEFERSRQEGMKRLAAMRAEYDVNIGAMRGPVLNVKDTIAAVAAQVQAARGKVEAEALVKAASAAGGTTRARSGKRTQQKPAQAAKPFPPRKPRSGTQPVRRTVAPKPKQGTCAEEAGSPLGEQAAGMLCISRKCTLSDD